MINLPNVKYLFYIVFITLIGLVTSCQKKESLTTKPNIILIYADDLGKGMLSHEGQKIVSTPHIDQLAAQGLRFTNAHSNMLCAPARASLITGLHDCHKDGFEITEAGIYKKISTGEFSPQQIENAINSTLSPIPVDQIFLGEVAQKMGYRTAQFGKLEWGFASTHQQMKRHGWDQYFGYLDHVRAHGFYPPFLFGRDTMILIDGNTRVDCGKSGEPETPETYNDRWDMQGKKVYSQDIIMDSVLHFINSHKDKPFFLYFPTQLPHGPVAIPSVHPDFEQDSSLTQIEKEYASMVKLLDDHVGQIISLLEKLQIAQNTLVIFMADNGHEIYYSEEGRVLKPYTNMLTGKRFDNYTSKYYSDLAGDVFNGNNGRAGMKRSNLEGGIHIPLIFKWPNQIQAGTTSDQLVASYDLLPTIATVLGYHDELDVDGKSFDKTLFGQEKSSDQKHIVFSSFEGPTLLTDDGWKLRTFLRHQSFELYYLPNDYREEQKLSEQYPDKLLELKELLLEACDGDFENGLYKGTTVSVNMEK